MARKTWRSKTWEEKQAEAKGLHDKISEKVEHLCSTEEWKRALTFMGQFHEYSLNNIMLILSQFPEASQVAGFRKWQEMGRQVRKGEKGIKIFGFSQKKQKDPENGEEVKKTYFPMLTVFDISQTDLVEDSGYEPQKAPVLVGDFEGRAPLAIDVLTNFLNGEGWVVEYGETGDERLGYTKIKGPKIIRVKEGLAPALTFRVLLHEAAHAILHYGRESAEYAQHRGLWETEAESVAYVVAGVIGMDTSEVSVDYVAGWAEGDVDLIKSTAGVVLSAAHKILEGIM